MTLPGLGQRPCGLAGVFLFYPLSLFNQSGGVQPHLGPWPLTKNLLAMGLKDGPYFFIVLFAWKCDETNFELLLRIYLFSKIYFSSEDFSLVLGPDFQLF